MTTHLVAAQLWMPASERTRRGCRGCMGSEEEFGHDPCPSFFGKRKKEKKKSRFERYREKEMILFTPQMFMAARAAPG